MNRVYTNDFNLKKFKFGESWYGYQGERRGLRKEGSKEACVLNQGFKMFRVSHEGNLRTSDSCRITALTCQPERVADLSPVLLCFFPFFFLFELRVCTISLIHWFSAASSLSSSSTGASSSSYSVFTLTNPSTPLPSDVLFSNHYIMCTIAASLWAKGMYT